MISKDAAFIWALATLNEEDRGLLFGGELGTLVSKYKLELTEGEFHGLSTLPTAENAPVIEWLCLQIDLEAKRGVCPTFPDC